MLKNAKTGIICCHGCFGYSSQFGRIEYKLIKEGYKVFNFSYTSPSQSIEYSSNLLMKFLLERYDNKNNLKFIWKEELSALGKTLIYMDKNLNKLVKKKVERNEILQERNEQEKMRLQQMSDVVIDNFHFISHSMGSLVVRKFLINVLQEMSLKDNELQPESENRINPVCDILKNQSEIKFIQISPLLGGRSEFARKLKFLYPVLPYVVRNNEKGKETCVEELMNDTLFNDKYQEDFWWNENSDFQQKLHLYDIVTSNPIVFNPFLERPNDLVLTEKEQMESRPNYILPKKVFKINSTHNYVLFKKEVLETISNILKQ
ncbi:hypothetical protein ABK040_006817 [Willaertia magna]